MTVRETIHTKNGKNKGSHSRHDQSRITEHVLVLQGGGSLGAFACGVFKVLARKGIRLDIVAGSSIGAINAAIIAGARSSTPEKDLEDFWMEIAESSYKIMPNFFLPDYNEESGILSIKEWSSAGVNAAFFGVPKMFMPRWLATPLSAEIDRGLGALPQNWTYVYDHSPLGKTLEKYIDFTKIQKDGQEKSVSSVRLIVTAVSVLTAEPIVFDNYNMAIQTKHLLACTGYPLYGFPWVEIEDEVYAWDGSLLDNTPLRQVIRASPRNDKHVYIVENYPRKIDRLPSSLMEVLDRTRDIIFSDKTEYSIRMSKFITRQIRLIENLYEVFESADHSKFDHEKINSIKEEYTKLVDHYGAEILSVNRIVREHINTPHMAKNADFSPETIKNLIRQGEKKTIEYLEIIS